MNSKIERYKAFQQITIYKVHSIYKYIDKTLLLKDMCSNWYKDRKVQKYLNN